ncbi:hypothetical protein HOV93_40200 [Planctomycetes bacterium FF15]|uniref:Uncharacterized protein n=1 Tax=Bremerella alba TaxID=980252 RepID=A0A7V9A8V8_9BACT|nr:hypothetical protein [Bremerella alba]
MTFTDSHGDVWRIVIDEYRLAAMKKVLPLGELKQTARSHAIEFIFPCLYLACLDDIERRGLTAEAFLKRLAGPTMGHAVKAVTDQLTRFFKAVR